MRILVVCSANRCRSPMAAALLRARLGELGIPVEVASAGFGPAGQPPLEEAVSAMARIGIDLSGHRSVTVTPGLCEEADLVLGMTRQHVIDLVLLAPAAWPRTFPIVDFVARAEQAGPRRPAESVAGWVRRAHGGRQRAAVMTIKAADEVADPVGMPAASFERTRDRLDDLAGRMAVLLTPSSRQLQQ